MRTATKKQKRNIWTDESQYGTYTGSRGNSEDWRDSFFQSYTRAESIEIIKNDSPWTILGIAINSTTEEIKKAFRQKMLVNHPDKGGDLELCKKIIAAYTILMERN